MTSYTPQKRAGKQAFRCMTEDTAGFNSEPADWGTDAKLWPLLSLTEEGIDSPMELENEEVRWSHGERPAEETEIYHDTATLQVEGYPIGLGGDGAGDSVDTSTMFNAYTYVLSACLGSDPEYPVGDTIKTGTTPTASSVDVTTPASFLASGFAGFIDPATGKMHVRPYTLSGETLTLLMALPFTPSADDEVYALICVKHTGDHAASLWAEVVGSDKHDTYTVGGGVGSMSHSEKTGAQAQTTSVKFKVASSSDLETITPVNPGSNGPTPNHPGDFYIAKYGSSVVKAFHYLRHSFNTEDSFEVSEAVMAANNIDGWLKIPGSPRLNCKFRRDDTPPTGISAATWREVHAPGNEADNRFHILHQYGHTPGRIVVEYWSDCVIMMKPKPSKVDNKRAMDVTFGFNHDHSSTISPFWCGQG